MYSNHAIFNDVQIEEEAAVMQTWKSASIKSEVSAVYIEKYRGSPLKVNISLFKQSGASQIKSES
jgi:hypothetical protein